MNCTDCNHFQDTCLILVKQVKNPSTRCVEANYWKQGYRCSWNRIRTLNINELKKGNCPYEGE